jgi:hypothetical protein
MTVTTGARGSSDHVLLVHRTFVEEGVGIVELGSKRLVAHFLDDDHRRLLVQRLIDGHHRTHLHQRLDHLGRLDRHLVREVGDRDRLGDIDLMRHRLDRQLEGMLFVFVAGTTRPLAVLVVPPAHAAGHPARLQTGTLVGPFGLPLALLVGDFLFRRLLFRRLLVDRLLVSRGRRLGHRFVQRLVFRRPFARRLRRHQLGRPGRLRGDRLVEGILLRPGEVGGALLLVLVLGFLESA